MDKSFNQKCYELLEQLPAGKITTYKELANALNSRAYRAVGNAMANNKNLFVVPCHRVIKSNGEVGDYALGHNKKVELLKKEGVVIKNGKVVNVNQVMHSF